jgi:hypothetical protein
LLPLQALWHVTCVHVPEKRAMATKMRMMKLLQEIRGFADITNRRPPSRQPGLFLIQLRSHIFNTSQSSRRRTIVVEMQEQPDIPHPVKITHLQPEVSPLPAAALLAS